MAKTSSIITQNEHIKPFKLERFLAKYESSAPHFLCRSSSEPLRLQEALSFADDETLELWGNLSLGYPETQGLPLLRKEISQLYRTVAEDDVLVLVPEEGIFLTMLALLTRGDHVVVTYPAYQSLYDVARWRGCDVVMWDPQEKPDGSLKFEVDKLLALMQSDTKLVVINFPHNPTGCQLSDYELKTVVSACAKTGCYLLSDEIYKHLTHDITETCPSAVDLYDRALTLNGMSKSFGMPGTRIGWIACRDRQLLTQILSYKDYTTTCSNAPGEVLAVIGLRARDAIVKQQCNIVLRNLQLLDEFFTKYKDIFNWHRPTAGTVAFVKLLTGEPIDQFCERCVHEVGVVLLPATLYDHQPSEQQGRFRLGFARKDMPECLEAFERFVVNGVLPRK